MEKYIEENPFDVDREDNERINKRDIKAKKYSTTGFVPLEQIPDIEDVQEQSEEEEVVRGEFSDEYEYVGEESEWSKRDQQNNRTEMYIQHNDGTVSVGVRPEEEIRKNIIDQMALSEERAGEIEIKDNILEPEYTPRISVRKADDPIRSMSPEQVMRASRDDDRYIKSNNRFNRIERENLKTQSSSKKERGIRGFLRDLFHFGTSQEKDEQFDMAQEEYQETLNDAPIPADIRKIQQQEEQSRDAA